VSQIATWFGSSTRERRVKVTTETEGSKCDREQHSIGVIANQAHAAATIQIRDRIKEFRRVQAKDLVPNPKNWRRHPKAQVEALRGLLTEIGYADALLVRELADGRLMLIDGHLRAATTPDALVPVLVLDVTEAEADKLLATLDPLAAMAESDSERIKELLATVSTDSEAVQELLKRTAGERVWELLHPRELKEVEIAPEKADELRQKWSTKSGQLWQIDLHRIVCGDSTDPAIVGKLWSDDSPLTRIVLTDPPYGVSYGEKTDWTNRHSGGPNRRPIENDSLGPAELQKLFAAALNLARKYSLPGGAIYATVPSVFLKYFIQGLEDGGFTYRHCLVWIKQTFVLGRSDYHYRHEPILYGWIGNGPHYFVDDRTHDSVFEVDRPQASDLHPTTKPVELIARMIANSSRPGDLVYDPFGGSGSTIIAAHQLGRIGYACELDPGYIAVQLERLSMLGLKPEMVGK
jgi:DNA modification methylase